VLDQLQSQLILGVNLLLKLLKQIHGEFKNLLSSKQLDGPQQQKNLQLVKLTGDRAINKIQEILTEKVEVDASNVERMVIFQENVLRIKIEIEEEVVSNVEERVTKQRIVKMKLLLEL